MSWLNKFEKFKFEFNGLRLPEVKITDEEKQKVGAPLDADNYTYFTYLCNRGFEERLLEKKIKPEDAETYTKQCKLELEVFKKNGLIDYFLIIYDILSWCDRNNIPRGVARGSSSGSVCLYLLKITNISPITHSLYFTRFVNEARLQSKMIDGVLWLNGSTVPDIDSDISYEKRQNVIKYVEEKYKGRTSKIGTQISLEGRILIKEVVKAYLGYNEEQSLVISGYIDKHFGETESMETAAKNNKYLKKWISEKPENKEAFDIACSLEGLIKAKGQHPSGIAISFDDIKKITPLELSSSKEVVTGYDMKTVSEMMVKVDLLGLRNVDVNYHTCKQVGIEDPYSIDINHPSIYEYLKTSDLYFGLFQIESGLSKDVVLKVKPKNIDESAACISISRPGGLSYIDKYVKYVNEGVLESIHPELDKYLKTTGNIILFQEQINQICENVFKMSAIDADQVRYAIGKKRKDLMQKWEPVIFEKGKENNIPEDIIKYFWDTCNKSADYLFVKGHGYSYAYMCAINCYLKANHPKEFYLSLLNMAKGEPNTHEVINEIYSEMIKMGIELLPPHILKSDMDFKTEEKGVRFGLSSIKGIADKTIEKVTNFRKHYLNKFEIFKTAEEAELPINILSSLILVGCLDDDSYNTSRPKLTLEAQLYRLLTEKEKKHVIKNGEKFNYNLIETVKYLKTAPDEKGKPIIKASRYETIKKHYKPLLEMYDYNKRNERATLYLMEKQLLGYSYSVKLIDLYQEECNGDLISVSEVNTSLDDEWMHFVGEIIEMKEGIARNEKKTKYLKYLVKDETGQINVMLFNDKIEEHKQENDGLGEKNDIVVIKGRKKGDSVFAQKIGIQDVAIVKKISELKDKK